MKVQTLVTIEKGKLKELKERLRAADARASALAEAINKIRKQTKECDDFLLKEIHSDATNALLVYMENS